MSLAGDGGRKSVACSVAHRELEQTVTQTSSEPLSWSRNADAANDPQPDARWNHLAHLSFSLPVVMWRCQV